MLKTLCSVTFAASAIALFTLGGPAIGVSTAVWLGLGTVFSGFIGGMVGGFVAQALTGSESFAKTASLVLWSLFSIDTCNDYINEYKQKAPEPTVKTAKALPEQGSTDIKTIADIGYADIKEIPTNSFQQAFDEKAQIDDGTQKDNSQPKDQIAETVSVVKIPEVIKNSDTANSNKGDINQSTNIPLSWAMPTK